MWLLIISLLLCLGLLGKISYGHRELKSSNQQLNTQLMQADLDLGRAKTEFGDAQKHIFKAGLI